MLKLSHTHIKTPPHPANSSCPKIQPEPPPLLGGFRRRWVKRRPKKADFGVPRSLAQTPEGLETLELFPQLPKLPCRAGGNQSCRGGKENPEIFVSLGRFAGVSWQARGAAAEFQPFRSALGIPFVSWSQRSLNPVLSPAQILPLWDLRDFPFQGAPGILFPLETSPGHAVGLHLPTPGPQEF